MQSVAPIGKRKFDQSSDWTAAGKVIIINGGDERPPLPVLPVNPEVPISRGQGNMKMKRADEQEQGQHQDEIVIGSGKPRFFASIGLWGTFEFSNSHESLLTKTAVYRIAV